jgi:hypothetical protein
VTVVLSKYYLEGFNTCLEGDGSQTVVSETVSLVAINGYFGPVDLNWEYVSGVSRSVEPLGGPGAGFELTEFRALVACNSSNIGTYRLAVTLLDRDGIVVYSPPVDIYLENIQV